MPTPPIDATAFKAYFVRDFAYGSTPDVVMDADINKALDQGMMVFNPAIWSDTGEAALAFKWVAAHFLVIDIQAAGGLSADNLGLGVESQGGGTIQSKSVGGVSVSLSLPAAFTESPILNQFMRTDYGQKYLAMLAPRLVGNFSVVAGWNDLGPA